MEQIGEVTLTTLHFLGIPISFNPIMLWMTWLVILLLLIFSYFITKNIRLIPVGAQNVFEIIYDFLDDIIVSSLGEEDNRRFGPFLMTIFIFILVSNWIGVFPNFWAFIGTVFALIHKAFGGDIQIVYEGLTNIQLMPNPQTWYYFLFKVHAIEEPTKFLSTDLALAILVFFVVHYNAIKERGIVDYFKGYMEPFPAEKPWIYFFFLNPFFYLNIIGEIAKVVSHSFRLFGNIFGGAIIIVIVSELVRYFLVPVGLFAFFGLFAGLIQAFVFTMLAVTYIAVQK